MFTIKKYLPQDFQKKIFFADFNINEELWYIKNCYVQINMLEIIK